MAQLGDAQALSVSATAKRVGLSRQAVQQAARRLEATGLARRDESGQWAIDPSAVEQYEIHGVWPRLAITMGSATRLTQEPVLDSGTVAGGGAIDAVDQAELRVALAVAGEHAALLRARDERIIALEQRVADLSERIALEQRSAESWRISYLALLEARLAEVRRAAPGEGAQG